MAKYSRKAGEKVEEEMREMKEGKLKTGTGKKVTNPKQAIAIGLSVARKEGAKVPRYASAKKAAPKKAAASKAGAKKSATKKASVKKASPKKSAAKKRS